MPYISGINPADICCTYRPTPLEIKMLEVLTDPANENLNATEKMELVGCSRNTYYRILKKPEFNYILNQQYLITVRENLGKVIKKTLQYGLEEKGNYQDRKMLLQMAQLLADRSGNPTVNIGVNATSTGIDNPFSDLSADELKALAKKYAEDPENVIIDVEGLNE